METANVTVSLHSTGANGATPPRVEGRRLRWGTVLKWAACVVALGFLVRALLHADLPRAAARIADARGRSA
jgi:hypothetical protein